MAAEIPGAGILKAYGIRVDRATAALPQTTTGTLFTVTGGRIIVTAIVGEVTTAIQAQANAIKLVSTPTSGPSTDMCATVESNGAVVGTLYGITGLPANAMIAGGSVPTPSSPPVVPAGAIRLTAAASNTGSVKWSIFYIPLDAGASVVAA